MQYHINNNGEQKPCTTTPEKCRFSGNGPHFDTQEEAAEYVEKKMESKNTKPISKSTKIKPKSKIRPKEKINKKKKVSRTGLEADNSVREGSGLNNGSIRFFKKPTGGEVDAVTRDLNRRWQHKNSGSVSISNRHANATGVPTIKKNHLTGDYSYGVTRMGSYLEFKKSDDLRTVVRAAGDDEGFDPDEYDPRDWDE